MVGYVQNIEALLMKSMISATPQMAAETLQEAWHQANLAQTNLGQLPVTQGSACKYLEALPGRRLCICTGQTEHKTGKGLLEDQYKQLEQLHQYSVSLRTL